MALEKQELLHNTYGQTINQNGPSFVLSSACVIDWTRPERTSSPLHNFVYLRNESLAGVSVLVYHFN